MYGKNNSGSNEDVGQQECPANESDEDGLLLCKETDIQEHCNKNRNCKRRRVSFKSESEAFDDDEDILSTLFDIKDSIHLSQKSTESYLSLMGLIIIFVLIGIVMLNVAFVNDVNNKIYFRVVSHITSKFLQCPTIE